MIKKKKVEVKTIEDIKKLEKEEQAKCPQGDPEELSGK